MLTIEEIETRFASFWKPGYGSASTGDLQIIQSLINHYKPSCFLEIGMASGLSAGFISLFMDDQGGGELVSIDHDNTFFGDTSKENGFLIDTIYTSKKVKVYKKPYTRSINLINLDFRYDMTFIDANHQHPWPTIDLLMSFPCLKGSKIAIFDDLDLYQKQKDGRGIGPKILFDQFSYIEKNRPSRATDLFYLDLSSVEFNYLADAAAHALFYPWSTLQPIPSDISNNISKIIDSYYGKKLTNVFKTCLDRYNQK